MAFAGVYIHHSLVSFARELLLLSQQFSLFSSSLAAARSILSLSRLSFSPFLTQTFIIFIYSFTHFTQHDSSLSISPHRSFTFSPRRDSNPHQKLTPPSKDTTKPPRLNFRLLSLKWVPHAPPPRKLSPLPLASSLSPAPQPANPPPLP